MRVGGLIDDLPMDELDEMEDPRNTHYEFSGEAKFRAPTAADKGPGLNKTPSKGTMRQFSEAPPKLEAQKLWPGEGSPDGPDH